MALSVSGGGGWMEGSELLLPGSCLVVGNVSVLKAVMKIRGMDLGPPRLPLLPVSPQSLKALEAELKSLGFHSWA